MRLLLPLTILAATCALGARATAQQTNDVGLGLAALGLQSGTICDPLSCAPVPVDLSSPGQAGLVAYGPPGSPYAIAVAAPGTACRTVPGFLNGVWLGAPVHTLRIGVIGALDPTLPCRQGRDATPLSVPAGLGGVQVGIQSVGVSALGGGRPAFSRPLLLTLR